MKSLGKDYFTQFYAWVNSPEYESATISLLDPIDAKLYPNSLEKKQNIVNKIKTNGICLVQFNKKYTINYVVQWQKEILGEIFHDSGAHKNNYSRIVSDDNGKYFANTNLGQPVHADDAHTQSSPRIITLFCEKQSKKGGISTLVKLSEWLSTEENKRKIPEKCYKSDAVEITGTQGKLLRPLFIKDHNSKILCNFPSILYNIQGDKAVIEYYQKIMQWIHNPINQTRIRLQENQLLIIDNYRVLHGRTKFSHDDSRLLYRVCFGDGILK